MRPRRGRRRSRGRRSSRADPGAPGRARRGRGARDGDDAVGRVVVHEGHPQSRALRALRQEGRQRVRRHHARAVDGPRAARVEPMAAHAEARLVDGLEVLEVDVAGDGRHEQLGEDAERTAVDAEEVGGGSVLDEVRVEAARPTDAPDGRVVPPWREAQVVVDRRRLVVAGALDDDRQHVVLGREPDALHVVEAVPLGLDRLLHDGELAARERHLDRVVAQRPRRQIERVRALRPTRRVPRVEAERRDLGGHDRRRRAVPLFVFLRLLLLLLRAQCARVKKTEGAAGGPPVVAAEGGLHEKKNSATASRRARRRARHPLVRARLPPPPFPSLRPPLPPIPPHRTCDGRRRGGGLYLPRGGAPSRAPAQRSRRRWRRRRRASRAGGGQARGNRGRNARAVHRPRGRGTGPRGRARLAHARAQRPRRPERVHGQRPPPGARGAVGRRAPSRSASPALVRDATLGALLRPPASRAGSRRRRGRRQTRSRTARGSERALAAPRFFPDPHPPQRGAAMDTSRRECQICCERRRTVVECAACNYRSCRVCDRRLAEERDAARARCGRGWCERECVRRLGLTYCRTALRRTQAARCLRRELLLVPHARHHAARERKIRFLVREVRRLTLEVRRHRNPEMLPDLRVARFSLHRLLSSPARAGVVDGATTYFGRCPQPDCPGLLSESGVCALRPVGVPAVRRAGASRCAVR